MARSGQASVEVLADFSKFAATFQRDLNAAMRGVRIDMTGVSDQISNGVREGVDAANQELRRLGNQAGETFNLVTQKSAAAGRSMAASFASAGREMSSVGDQMTMALSLPIGAAGVATINAAGNFEKAMNKVKAATESSGKEFRDLRDLAIELGSTTAFSASEAAYAMNELATAGFDTNEIMGALPGVLDMAAAGSVSLSSAAEIASGILNGFGFAATDLSYVNDVLARDFLSTATTLSDLGESFKYVGPTAKSAGLTFTEVAAAIGLMGNAGIKGSMAGTALNASISRLLKPTAEVETTLRDLGVTVTNSSGKLLPLVEIMRQLEKSGASTADMITLFGLEAGPDMMALLSQGSAALTALDLELQNAGGTAQKVATTQMAGFNGSLDELTSAAEGLMIAIGDAGLLGWMTSLVDKLTELTMSASKLSPNFLKITTIIAVVVAAIGPFLAIFGRMATAIGEGIIAFRKFGSWALKVAPWLSALGGPVGLVVAAIVALGIAAVVAYKKSEVFRNVVDRAFRAVATAAVWMWQNAIVPAFNWIVTEAKVVGAAIVRLWKQARPVFVAWGAAVTRIWKSVIQPAFESIGNSFKMAGAAIVSFWTGTAQPALMGLMGLFARVATAIRSWWAGNGDMVMRTAAAVMTWLGGVAFQVWSGFMTVLRAVAAVVTWVIINVTIPMFRALVSVIRTVVTTVMSMRNVWIVVGAVIVAAIVVVAAIVKVLWVVITTAFRAMAAIIRWWWTTVLVPAFTVAGVVIKAFVAVITWMWTSVVAPVFAALGAALNVVGGVIIWLWTSVIQPVFTAIGAVVLWVWTSVIQPVFNAITVVIGAVVTAVTWLWTTFGPVFTAIGNLVWTVWSGVISVVFSLLKLAFTVIIAVVQVFWTVVKAAFMAVGAVVMMVWSTFISPVLSAIGALFTWLWGVIQPVLSAIGALFTWLWSSAISPFITWVSGALSSLWGIIQTIFTAVVSLIRGAINQIVLAANGVTAFVNAISSHFQAAVNSIRDKINMAVSVVRGLPGQIIGAVGNLGSLLYNAGQNVINGLINGISSRIGAIRDKMAEAASMIRNHLPFSPAKVGPLSGAGDPTKSGAKIVEMVATGMEYRIPELNAISQQMAQTVLDSLPSYRTGTTGVTPATGLSNSIPLAPALTTIPGQTGGTTTVTYQITVNSLDPRTAGTIVIDAVREYERRNGKSWRS
jgi:TP901 family phage tail tape measure protein